MVDSKPTDFDPLDEYAEELLEHGITQIPEYADKNKCIEVRNQLNDLAEGGWSEATYLGKHQSIKDYEYDKNECVVITRGEPDEGMLDIRNADAVIPELEDFLYDEYLQRLVDSVTEIEYKPEMRVYINESVTHTRNYHADNCVSNPFGGGKFKSFVYLTDVPDDSYGPYSFIKGSHRDITKRFLNMYLNIIRGERYNEMNFFYKKDAETFHAERGDVVMSNQVGVHRGIPQEEGKKRIVLVITYMPK